MVPIGRVAAVVAVCIVALSGLAMLAELELVSYSSGGPMRWPPSHAYTRADYGTDILINPAVRLPNERRKGVSPNDIASDVGTRSVHNGDHQRRRQLWLEERADFLRAEGRALEENEDGARRLAEAAVPGGGRGGEGAGTGTRGAGVKAMVGTSPEGGEAPIKRANGPSPQGQRGGAGRGGGGAKGGGGAGAGGLSLDERLHRLEKGLELWGATYVPPIAPEEWQRLADKWTNTAGNGTEVGASRILFVVTSFDRGGRLGQALKGVVDKLDYMLMIMDEIREACEAGFTMTAHIISAWNTRLEKQLFNDRLFCRRIGEAVPISFEQHPPAIKEVLSIKHRMYMSPRLDQHDLFIQAEDDMIFTVNHMLLYLEESEKLTNRRRNEGVNVPPNYDFMPGFIRVEPGDETQGVGGEWFQWEIILSRIRGKQIKGAGTYLSLEKSRVLLSNGNNQGMWLATREQLRYLERKCRYLRYTDKSALGFVEKFSGSIEMFSSGCQTTKVFPAARFEDFLVHHRTNNKKGKRGESLPPVSVSIMRFWASQILRDSGMLAESARRRRLAS